MELDLNLIWFVLVGVLFTGYAMLDGFDLGVGILHLFVREDEERRILLNAIGPVWDGNQFEPRTLLPLALSYDHRVVNGGDGGRFLTRVVALLSDIRRLLM